MFNMCEGSGLVLHNWNGQKINPHRT